MKLQLNGVALNVLGNSPTVHPSSSTALVFLHFFGGSSRAWCEVIERLGDFRCIAPDLRGFGDSSAADGYSVNQNADDVAALIASLQLERFVLIGHSMGGKTALALAARRPLGLQGLVLLAPSPPSPEPIMDEVRQRLLDGFGSREAAEATLRLITGAPLSPALGRLAVDDALRSSRSAWRAWLETGSREDISASMTQINVPVLVVAGDCDPGLGADVLQPEVVERIAGARLVHVPGAGHLLPLEAPQRVADLIRGAAADGA